MSSLRGFIGRHAGVLLALLVSSVFAGLLAGRAPRLRVALPAHEAHVVAFSPDSRVLLTDGDSGGCIRDAVTGRVRVRLMRAGARGPAPATDITWPRFTADGRRVIVQFGGPRFGSEPRVTLAVFDVATGRECASFEGVGSGTWHGSALPPAEYALSADGSTLAFCRATGFGPERTGQVTVWDVVAEKVVAEFPGLTPLALSPDGSAVAHGDNDDARARRAFPTIRALESGRSARTRPRGLGASTGLSAGPVAFSADGKLLAGRILGQREVFDFQVRDVASGRVRAVPHPNDNDARWLSPENVWFSPDARILFLEDIGGYTSTNSIQCWDICGTLPCQGPQGPAERFSTDGSRAVITQRDFASRWNPMARDNSVVEVFSLHPPQSQVRLIETGVQKASISPNGRIMALLSNRVEVRDWQGFGPVLRRILRAVGLGSRGPATDTVSEIKLCDAATGKIIGTVPRPRVVRLPGSMTFSPDSKTLVVKDLPADFSWESRNPTIDWSVELWDVPTGWQIGRISLLAAAALVLAAVWFDRRRARRARPSDAVGLPR